MQRRRIRPSVRHRLRRRVVFGLPRTARVVHRVRAALRRGRVGSATDRRPPAHPAVLAVGNPYCLHVLYLGRAGDRCARALEGAGAHVTAIAPGELERVVADAFDLAVALGAEAPVTALLERVQLVVTDAPPGTHGDGSAVDDSEMVGGGLHHVCRRVDPIVDGTRYRAIHSRVHSSALAPLLRRRRYTHAVHPTTGQEVFVKWIGTSGLRRREQRRLLSAERRALRALQANGGPGAHLPHLLGSEVGRRHGALVTAHVPGRTLDDPSLVLDLDGSRRVLREISTALVTLLDRTGLHHNDVMPYNIGVGPTCVLFDLDRASRRRCEPFAVELTRLTAAIRARLPADDHAAWDTFVDALPTAGPHALLEHLGGAVSPPARSAAVLR